MLDLQKATELYKDSENQLDEMKKTIDQLYNSDDWKPSKKEDDVEYFTRSVQDSKFTMIKSTTIVEKSASELVDFLNFLKVIKKDMTPAERDGAIERQVFNMEGENPHGNAIVYLALESGSRFVSPRDFFMARKYFEEGDKYYFIVISIDDKGAAPAPKGLVRGKILCNATIVEKIDDKKSRLSFIAHGDPCGSVPAMIYNQVAVGQGACVKKIRDEITKAWNTTKDMS